MNPNVFNGAVLNIQRKKLKKTWLGSSKFEKRKALGKYEYLVFILFC